MKSLIVIAAAAGVFGWVLFDIGARADSTVSEEDAARERLRTGPELPSEHGDYRFEDRAGLTVARPQTSGRRWFVSGDGGRTIWEFDTVRHRARPEGPDLEPLRRFLERAADRRGAPPLGWEQARADG